MACASLLLLSVLASLTPGLPDVTRSVAPAVTSTDNSARPPPGKIDLSLPGAIHDPAMVPSSRSSEWAEPQSDRQRGFVQPPGIAFGPLHTEFGGMAGRHMQLATMRLEGVSVLGASIGGSVDSRSARIMFTWPTHR